MEEINESVGAQHIEAKGASLFHHEGTRSVGALWHDVTEATAMGNDKSHHDFREDLIATYWG